MPFAITYVSSVENQSGDLVIRGYRASQTRERDPIFFHGETLSPPLLLITRLSFAGGGSGSESRALPTPMRGASLISRDRFSRDSTRNAERSESPRRIARRFAERAVFHSRLPLFGVLRLARMCARDTAHDGVVSRPRSFFHEKSLTKTKNRRQSDRAWRRDNVPLLLGFAYWSHAHTREIRDYGKSVPLNDIRIEYFEILERCCVIKNNAIYQTDSLNL